MLHIQCDQCGASVIAADGSDPDAALSCGCCPQDHHHGQAAGESGEPCRPITITVGQVTVGPAGGLN
jgi:hypothetical protein